MLERIHIEVVTAFFFFKIKKKSHEYNLTLSQQNTVVLTPLVGPGAALKSSWLHGSARKQGRTGYNSRNLWHTVYLFITAAQGEMGHLASQVSCEGSEWCQ